MKKRNDIAIRSSAAEYLTYIAATGDDSQSFEMRYEDENIWLTQKMLATLNDVGIPTINEHINKIFSDHELQEEATIRNFRIVQIEGSRQVNREVKHMGLTSWKDAPNGKIQKFDVSVAKNYLSESEMAQLQRLVSAYLDVAEDMALRHIPMTMSDWEIGEL